MYTKNHKLKSENESLIFKLKERNSKITSLQSELKASKNEISRLNSLLEKNELQAKMDAKSMKIDSNEKFPQIQAKKPAFLESVDTLNHEEYEFWENPKGKSDYYPGGRQNDEMKMRDIVKGDQNLWINQVDTKGKTYGKR